MGARGEGQEQPPVSRPSRICEIGSFRLGCCPTPPPARWSGGCFGHPHTHPLIVHLVVRFRATALSWEPVAPPELRDRLGGLFQQVRQPLGRVPLVPDVPPSRPVVPDAPPVIWAIRPVTALVGMGVLGLARTTRWPAVRPPVTWVYRAPTEPTVMRCVLVVSPFGTST